VAHHEMGAGVVDGSNNSPPHSLIGIKENHFDFTTTPALRATPPVPGGELLFPNLNSFTPSLTVLTTSEMTFIKSISFSLHG